MNSNVTIRGCISWKEMLTYSAILLAGELIMVNNIPYRTRGTFAFKFGDGKNLVKDLPYLS